MWERCGNGVRHEMTPEERRVEQPTHLRSWDPQRVQAQRWCSGRCVTGAGVLQPHLTMYRHCCSHHCLLPLLQYPHFPLALGPHAPQPLPPRIQEWRAQPWGNGARRWKMQTSEGRRVHWPSLDQAAPLLCSGTWRSPSTWWWVEGQFGGESKERGEMK